LSECFLILYLYIHFDLIELVVLFEFNLCGLKDVTRSDLNAIAKLRMLLQYHCISLNGLSVWFGVS